MLKYLYISQQANINRQQAIDIAENRTNRPAPIELSSRLIGAGHAHKPLFGKQGKVLNLDHLYFDIVSDLELPISDFASLGLFTLVKNSLQIGPFMQNKPNVKYAQINVNSYMISKYEKLDTWLSGKNKPNSNPNKPNLRKAKMNVNLTLTKDYRKKDDFIVRINKPNLQNAKNERKVICYRGL